VANWEDSALGHLINGGQPLDVGQWPMVLHTAWGGTAHTLIEQAPTPVTPLRSLDAPPAGAIGPEAEPEPVARTYQGQTRHRWWIASYSALRLATPDTQAHLAMPDTAQDDLLLESDAPLDLGSSRIDVDTAPGAHNFPKGSTAGTLLHDALQWCADQGWTHALHHPQRLRDKVTQLCQSHGWDAWADAATDWLIELIQTPLPLPAPTNANVPQIKAHPGPCLAQLTAWQAEMEFWLAVAPANAQDLDRLVTQHTLDAAPRPSLQADQLNGMLKGFIDLVFEHEGRYYVADYKSNWLGPDDGDYTHPRLQQAVLESRYDLQYSLYLLALHRLLRQRLPGYDYDQHMGGAVYLFLRGWRGPARGVLHERPPRELIEAMDRLFEQGSAAC
jgi:exodeoxyribonuclease V beta subunit